MLEDKSVDSKVETLTEIFSSYAGLTSEFFAERTYTLAYSSASLISLGNFHKVRWYGDSLTL